MINPSRKYKIALIGDSLTNGGAEKVHSLLSVYFENAGMEVLNCIFCDLVTYKYSGSLLNLGEVNPHSFFITRKLKRFFVFRKFIKNNDFDFVIDFRQRTNFILELLISKDIYPKNTYYTVHSGVLDFYFPKAKFLSNLIYKNRNIVAVSKAVKEEIQNKKTVRSVDFIYNPIDLRSAIDLKNQFKVDCPNYILAVGRMNDTIKQFDKLILAYSKSILPERKIKLVILGEGEKKGTYIKLAQKLGIESLVEFKGYISNPFPYYKNAHYLVLTSKNEGFSNVLVESLSAETPVIAFDCFAGPNEIIVDKENGILVENQKIEKLIEALNLFVEDKELYRYCKKNTMKNIERFSIDVIGKKWLELMGFENLSDKNIAEQ
ncbi:MAG TPA: glycosyltransferase [Flavobacterium sp.]|nr:glycosyltransferase [Flavobacterium sp.]